MSIVNSKYGFWVVGGERYFTKKYDALKFANQTNQIDVRFYFHDHIWKSFDRSQLGKTPLTTLYRDRALQLREKYDHLVLHYSGGSDSHNILHTFLNNNIRLDEISVKWAKPLRDGKFYNPNNVDKSAKNSASEWDFSIKPTLDFIKSKYPDIKITIVDFTENLNSLPTSVSAVEEAILDIKLYRGALGSFVQRYDPNVELKSSIKSISRKVGHIFGLEKPLLTVKDNNVYMRFSDAALETALLPNNMVENTAELFYWAHEFPQLPLEQAYQVALYFKNNPQYRDLLWPEKFKSANEASLKTSAQANIIKKVLYGHSWDFSRFQVDKPNEARSDWWYWVHESSELQTLNESYKIAMSNISSEFDPRMLIKTPDGTILRPLGTNLFFVLSLEE